jgi:membrane-bound lytic murein transglycosylase D
LQAVSVFGFLILIFLLYALLFSYTNPTVNQVSYSNNNSNVFNLSIPAKLNFCGEDIPTNDYRIKGVLEREFMQSQYSRSSTQLLFNKAQRWFGYIEAVLKQEGIPDDFKYLAVIESHLSNVHSPAGAAGFWQLIANSAINGGLTVNATVDERLNVEKATRAACGLIKQAHMVFKNWTLSAAAYNRGINGILRAMNDQGTRDYHQLLLNPETGTFVYRILAYKTLLSNPMHFGIKKKQLRTLPKISYKIFRVDSSIHNLFDFAGHIGVSYRTLKGHNPWLIADKLDNPSGITFEIKVPKNSKADYSNYLSDLHPLVNLASDTLRELKDSTAVKANENKVYVDAEISLEDLAKRFHVSSNDLIKWNRLDPKTNTLEKQHVIVIDPAEIK